ncbi:alkaline phosphatase family protein [Kordia zhangzhouensis]|uniref:phosphoglyceromutase n=1 Tax=Kordia zhangzhouensis TaxID=1620405 RepID=UPI0006297BDB|nr:phosphoglyceromutase [Kordia zhangzhouensis]
MQNKLIYIFLDGVGLGDEVATNPLAQVSMPTLSQIVGKKLIRDVEVLTENVLLKGIDACLGVKGVPQSATGQTCLFTGYNAQAFLGYHLMAYPNDELVQIIEQRSIFKYANEQGLTNIFANSYTDGFFHSNNTSRYSVTTRSVLAANNRFNTMDDLMKGKAVHWDITNSTLQELPNNRVPEVSPYQAGINLKNLTDDYDLVVFECFLPDLIGHRKDMEKARWFFELFDEFLRGILYNKQDNIHILISSDHGNIEDLSFGGHSMNEVPLLVIGKQALQFQNVSRIDEIFDAIFSKLFHVKN